VEQPTPYEGVLARLKQAGLADNTEILTLLNACTAGGGDNNNNKGSSNSNRYVVRVTLMMKSLTSNSADIFFYSDVSVTLY
jgi:hypothetical protein